MRLSDLIVESKSMPCIVVDVQPSYDTEYTAMYHSGHFPTMAQKSNPTVFKKIVQFVNSQTGPVLMFIDTEISSDTVESTKEYWEELGFNPTNWNRIQIAEKGYGYFRAWIDLQIPPSAIIKVIRYMYQSKVNDSRQLFGGDDSENYETDFRKLVGVDFEKWMLSDNLSINWTSVAQLKRYSGAYIIGGGRTECLKEIELLMNAFNIKYKRIDSLIYG